MWHTPTEQILITKTRQSLLSTCHTTSMAFLSNSNTTVFFYSQGRLDTSHTSNARYQNAIVSLFTYQTWYFANKLLYELSLHLFIQISIYSILFMSVVVTPNSVILGNLLSMFVVQSRSFTLIDYDVLGLQATKHILNNINLFNHLQSKTTFGLILHTEMTLKFQVTKLFTFFAILLQYFVTNVSERIAWLNLYLFPTYPLPHI